LTCRSQARKRCGLTRWEGPLSEEKRARQRGNERKRLTVNMTATEKNKKKKSIFTSKVVHKERKSEETPSTAAQPRKHPRGTPKGGNRNSSKEIVSSTRKKEEGHRRRIGGSIGPLEGGNLLRPLDRPCPASCTAHLPASIEHGHDRDRGGQGNG